MLRNLLISIAIGACLFHIQVPLLALTSSVFIGSFEAGAFQFVAGCFLIILTLLVNGPIWFAEAVGQLNFQYPTHALLVSTFWSILSMSLLSGRAKVAADGGT